MEAAENSLTKKIPTAAITLIIAAALASLIPALSELLIYDRRAIVSGSVWRLLTAPLVHFSASHLFWDSLIVLITGWLIRIFRFKGFILLFILTALLPGLWLLLAQPNLHYYGGLSGLGTAAVVYLAVKFADRYPEQKFIWIIILILVFGKIVIETISGGTVFSQIAQQNVRVLPSVHIIGAFCALLVFVMTQTRQSKQLE